ncbi:hypothetical protein LCGC14_0504420 [marine sediment metagenome]|uniref:Uncharacterized protein n=1 Tax=marine sediment metagenome TaxID=412755 RepID=A0A0F9SLB7_9ZZZZ
MKDWMVSLWVKAWFNKLVCPVPKKWRWHAVVWTVVAVVVLVVVWP